MRNLDPDRAVNDVGRRIAELRRARGWTQATFAERLGIQTNNLQTTVQLRDGYVAALCNFGAISITFVLP